MKKSNDNPLYAARMFVSRHRRWFTIGLVTLIILLTLGITRRMAQRGHDDDNVPLFAVKRGPLTISITETGAVENREKVVVKSEVEGQQSVIWLVEEGVSVEADDLLVELDTSKLESSRVDQEIALQNSESALIQAKESLAVARNQAQADIEAAELTLKFANMDLEKYNQGEFPQQLQLAEADITIAGEEVERAEDKKEWSTRLADKGFITRSELKGDELSLKRYRINLDLVKGELDLLKKYTHKKKLEQLESDVRQAEMALERTRRKSKASVVKAEADLRAKQLQYDRQKENLEKRIKQIENCRITAPVAGMVVYATSGGHRWRRGEPLEVGQPVRERQELIHLPTTSDMIAKLSIPETVRAKVELGMRALVHVDALEDLVLEGKLSKIGVLPDATRAWLNPDLKAYKCEVTLKDSPKDMRPGMSCRTEIVLEEYDDALYVPIQCIVRVKGRHVAMVMTRRGPKEREVTIGMDNRRMVHVLEGLEEGEEVLLAPPLDASAEDTETRPAAKAKTGQRPAARGKPTKPAGD